MSRSTIIQIVVGVGLLVVLSQTAYTVSETEQVVITQFGEPVGDPVVTLGLHFKVPFIQRTNVFDKRFLEWDGSPNQVPTRDRASRREFMASANESSRRSSPRHIDRPRSCGAKPMRKPPASTPTRTTRTAISTPSRSRLRRTRRRWIPRHSSSWGPTASYSDSWSSHGRGGRHGLRRRCPGSVGHGLA